MSILTVNAGSSSLKFSIHDISNGRAMPSRLEGTAMNLEPGGSPSMSWKRDGSLHSMDLPTEGGSPDEPFESAMRGLATLLDSLDGLPKIKAAAHRVVHGGSEFSASIAVDEASLRKLWLLAPLAPLHQPRNLQGIEAFQKAMPGIPQVACFDTAFHSTIPDLEHSFALPPEFAELGVRRYGFHGLSYQYVIGELARLTPRASGRAIVAHLGNGASMCAIKDGKSLSTTMGFSTLDGLMMGTRCGSMDPGVLLHLLAQGWTHGRLQDLLYKKSGLLGVSGLSADMRTLRQSHSPAAHRALDMFSHRVVKECGALAASLEGLDVLVFSGGIGEHDAAMRSQVCKQLGWMGVSIDSELNALAIGASAMPIHSLGSPVEVWVVPTDEGLVAASEAAQLIGAAG